MTDLCLHELTLHQLDQMVLDPQLHTLPLQCKPEGAESGEWNFYSGDGMGMGLGSN